MSGFRLLPVLFGWLRKGWFLIEADSGLSLDAMTYLTQILGIIF